VPVPTPFHQRTAALCSSLLYKEWAGYYAVRSYDTTLEREYFAIRHSAGLLDVTALYKYEVRGPDAGAFLSYVMVKDLRKLRPGRVTYLCWCDDDGKVVDDGTATRMAADHVRVTAAEPCYAWLVRHARGFAVSIEDVSARLGTLALQGPRSREILRGAATGIDMDGLKFFAAAPAAIAGVPVHITRTGYTGDLGYEVWVANDGALAVYDAILEAGQPHRMEPAGLDALDVTRVEAGFIMNGVDYHSAHQVPLESRKSTPYELGLGWTVELDREPFIGQAALRAEKQRGRARALVGLVYDWDEYEALFAAIGLGPSVPAGACRDPVPVFDDGGQVGRASTRAWSPILKKYLALATVDARCAAPGTRLRIEVTVEYQRKMIGAIVTPTPFFDPPRKKKP
jgi:aminomethyltransferase